MQLRRLPILAAMMIPHSGCVLFEPLIGEWELTDVEFDTSTTYLARADFEGEMVFDEELVGEFELSVSLNYETTFGSNEHYEAHEKYEATATNDGEGEYTIELEGNDGDDWEMSCELEDDELVCTGDDASLTFEKMK